MNKKSYWATISASVLVLISSTFQAKSAIL